MHRPSVHSLLITLCVRGALSAAPLRVDPLSAHCLRVLLCLRRAAACSSRSLSRPTFRARSTLCVRQVPRCTCLHSKLQTRRWPNAKLLERRCHMMLGAVFDRWKVISF